MAEIFLGNPSKRIKQWIIDHSKPATRETTRIWYDECPAEHDGAEYYDYDIEGTLDAKALYDLGLKKGDGITSNGITSDPSPRVNITKVEIGSKVTSIGNYAFYNCSSLTSIAIPDSVTSIGGQAFYYCSGLTSITIPDSVTSIGVQAFYYCSGLTSITIPGSVTSINYGAFSNCSGLTSITVDPNNAFYDSRNNCNALIETSTNELIAGCKNTTIPDSVTSIGSSAFSKCSGLTSITIPNSVTIIGDWAFYYCSGLTSITIPDSVTSIGVQAFYYCSGLTSIDVPFKTITPGPSKYSGPITDWNKVEMLNFPKLETINGTNKYMFSGCSSLTSVHFPAAMKSTIESHAGYSEKFGAPSGCSIVCDL